MDLSTVIVVLGAAQILVGVAVLMHIKKESIDAHGKKRN